SEDNMRKAIRMSESIAPAILWLDELEKGFAGTQSSGISDGGTTARVFASFITWLQEKTAPVFVVATANRIEDLPPELMRKGRFDEIFFVDLPEVEERADIFGIHFRKRKRDLTQFDLNTLAAAADGFSGAEIEQAIVAAMFDAFDAGRELTQADVMQSVRSSIPLSQTMREDIEALRMWASTRARHASHPAVAPPADALPGPHPADPVPAPVLATTLGSAG
ncbi:MAG: AAA family ATPase, partial [Armatimonadetes bacterium]|nr:AAA family ATPase [Armatimonadota bacterium]